MGKIIRFALIISAVLLLGPWITSFAYGDVDGDSRGAEVNVEPAIAPMLPEMNVFGQAIGGVTPGDLFYVDARDNPDDLFISLYITNAYELTHYLRYLILKVSVYCQDENGSWIKVTPQGTNPESDIYINLRNNPVNFNLPGLARYKIAIDSGSYYCIKAAENSADVSPQFYLTIEPS